MAVQPGPCILRNSSHLMRNFGLLLAVVLGVGTYRSVQASAVPEELMTFRATRNEMVKKLVDVSMRCVVHVDTSHPVFHGCIDWHSGVHGVWSLVAASEMLGDKSLLSKAVSLLPVDGIAAERRFLTENPTFEMPYGRAWFLRLAADFERLTGDRRLRLMGDEVAASLAKRYLEGKLNPLVDAYESPTWALINLRYYAESSGNSDLLRRIDMTIDQTYLTVPAKVCPGLNADANMMGFMPICTNWAWLVSQRLSPVQFRRWIHVFLPSAVLPPAISRPTTVHEHGLDFARAWGLWAIYWRSDDSHYLQAFVTHIQTAYAHKDWWNGDYGTLSHWIAQFGILALYQSYRDFP
jgi:hypothetical protein